jgi:hypothetical protein
MAKHDLPSSSRPLPLQARTCARRSTTATDTATVSGGAPSAYTSMILSIAGGRGRNRIDWIMEWWASGHAGVVT